MININFDRPYLLFIAIPLLALILIPFFVAIRRDNRTKGAVVSFIIHILMIFAITIVAAGLSVTRIITETNVYVIADVSHSSNRKLDQIDEYIKQIESNLPDNAKLGVIAFGEDYKLITRPGEEFTSVRNSGVDDSSTNIKAALEYAGRQFTDDTVNRIILITDGKDTFGNTVTGIASTVDALYSEGIYIDAIYLNNNLTAEDNELEVITIDYNPSTYLNHEATASALIQSSSSSRINAEVQLLQGNTVIDTKYPTMTQGYNVVNFDLPTDVSGTFDYSIVVKAAGTSAGLDSSDRNNKQSFTQAVASELKVLLITTNPADIAKAEQLYGESAAIDTFLNDPYVPCTIEELIKYDEIILSDTDIRTLKNFTSFVSSVKTVVADYGKTLMTFGDTKIQNKTDDTLKELEDILPVKYGNSDQDPKLVCIVMDVSRSMEELYKLKMAKEASKQLVDMLNDHDFVIIITFSGDYTTIWPSAPVANNKDTIKKMIDDLDASQGTVLAKGMKEAYDKVRASAIENKQIFLLSDGRTWANEVDNAVTLAEMLYEEDIPTSVINTATVANGDPSADKAIQLLKDTACAGAGLPIGTSADQLKNYYAIYDVDEVADLMLNEISNQVTETVIEGDIQLNINVGSDPVLGGITSTLPSIGGYIYSRPKASATTVITTDYVKESGAIIEAPIYAYWQCDTGRVATFTTSFSGAWVASLQEGIGLTFVTNAINNNIPTQR
ncbi:MAG: VWA domain-containing protein, partial [Clostridia bacterium]|nr:VWA domain-containing protein [Clostridia bacterium]